MRSARRALRITSSVAVVMKAVSPLLGTGAAGLACLSNDTLAGAAVVAIGHWLNLPSLPCALAGAGLCFGLRLMAMHFGWHLPVSLQGNSDDPPPADGPPR